MAIILTQTDTSSACTPFAACSGATLQSGIGGRACPDGGTAGSTEQSVQVTNNSTRATHFYDSGALNNTSWPAGTWTVRLNITATDPDITVEEIYICRVNSSCVSQATVGSVTGLGDGNSGVRTYNITGSAQTAASTDKAVIVVVCTNSANHGNSSIGITPDQDIDTTLPATLSGAVTIDASATTTFNGRLLEPVVIRQIEFIDSLISNTNTSLTYTLTTTLNDVNKAFLVFGKAGGVGSDGYHTRGYILSTTQVTFERDSSTGNTQIRAFVIEFTSGVYAEHFQFTNISDSTSQNLSTIDTINDSFLISSFKHNNTAWNTDIMPALYLTESGGTATINCDIAASSATDLAVTAVRIDKASVQRGSLTTMGSSDTSKTVAITAISELRSFLMFSVRTGTDAGDTGVNQFMIRGRITATNELTFDRDRSGTQAIADIRYEVVTLPLGSVQHVLASYPNATSEITPSINTVSTANTIAFVGSPNSRGKGSKADDDQVTPFQTRVTITSSTQLTLGRGSSSGTQDVAIEVIDFNASPTYQGAVAIDAVSSTAFAGRDIEPISIRQVEAFSVTFTASTSATHTLGTTLNDTSRAFLVFGVEGTGFASMWTTHIRGYISSTTQITFQRDTTTGTPTIRGFVIEFNSGVNVEHFQIDDVQDSTTQTLSDIVQIDDVFIINNGIRHNVGSFSEKIMIASWLTESSGVVTTNFKNGQSAASTVDIAFSVVRIHGASVQRGSLTTIGTSDTSKTDTISTVDLSKSFLSFSLATGTDVGTTGISQFMFRGRITSTTQLTFDRDSAGSQGIDDLRWEVIELPVGTVQEIAAGFPSADGDETDTITSVNTSNTIALLPNYGYLSKGSYTGADVLGDFEASAAFDDSTTLRTRRGSTNGTSDHTVYVVDFTAGGTTHQGAVLIDGSGSTTLDGDLDASGAVVIATSSTTTIAGNAQHRALLATDASSTTTFDAKVSKQGAVLIDGTSTTTQDADLTLSGAVLIDGTSTGTQAGNAQHRALLATDGVSTLTADGTAQHSALVSIDAVSATTNLGHRTTRGAVQSDAVSTLTATGKTAKQGAVLIDGTSTTTLDADLTLSGLVNIDSTSTTAISGNAQHRGIVTSDGTSVTVTVAIGGFVGNVSIDGVSNTAISGNAQHKALAQIDGVSTLLADGTVTSVVQGAVVIDASSTTAFNGTLQAKGNVQADGVSTLAADADLTLSGLVNIDSVSTTTQAGNAQHKALVNIDCSSTSTFLPHRTTRGAVLIDGTSTTTQAGNAQHQALVNIDASSTTSLNGAAQYKGVVTSDGTSVTVTAAIGGFVGNVAIDGVSSTTIAGNAQHKALFTSDAVSTLMADGSVTSVIQGAVVIDGSSTTSLDADLTLSGLVSIDGVSTTTSNGTAQYKALVNVDSTSTTTFDGDATFRGQLVSDGTSVTTHFGVGDFRGATNINGVSTTTVSGNAQHKALVTIDSTSTFVSDGTAQHTGLVQADSVSTLAADGDLTARGAFISDAVSTLIADGTLIEGGVTHQGAVVIDGSSTSTIDADLTLSGLVNVDGVSTVTNDADLTARGVVTSDGTSVTVTAAIGGYLGNVSSDAVSTLTANGTAQHTGLVTSDSVSTTSFDGKVTRGASVNIDSVSTTTEAAKLSASGAAQVDSVSSLSVLAECIFRGDLDANTISALNAAGALGALGNIALDGVSTFTSNGTLVPQILNATIPLGQSGRDRNLESLDALERAFIDTRDRSL